MAAAIDSVVAAWSIVNSNEAKIVQRREAQDYLLNFEKADVAWETCNQLLQRAESSLPLGATIYAAQT